MIKDCLVQSLGAKSAHKISAQPSFFFVIAFSSYLGTSFSLSRDLDLESFLKISLGFYGEIIFSSPERYLTIFYSRAAGRDPRASSNSLNTSANSNYDSLLYKTNLLELR